MKKLLSLILALALMASFTAVFAASETEPAPDLPPEAPVETESLVTEDLKKQIVPEAEVPDLIDYSVAVEEKYVCRAYWEETDLNEVVFLKSDGTLARYYFAIPVKYEEDGEVYDKKPALVERETLLNNLYRYELTAQNDTAFYCPDNLTYGFLYQGGGMEVALRPITQSEYDFLRGHMNAGDMVLPQNILPEGFDSQAVTGTAKSALSVTDEETTAARYVLSTEGEQVNSAFASQDILSAVPSYNGFQLQLDLAEGALTQTVYFELDSELLPVPTEGGLLLCDHTGKAVGILGDLLSESGVQNDIPWTVTESLSGTYLLSATLPRNGQTYTVSTTQYFDYLLDATIYSVRQQNYGQSANLWIGYHSSDGMERVLIRPNNWYFTESAAPNQVVQTATITLRDITATEHEAGIEVRPFFGEVWQENTVTWEAVDGTDYGAVLDTKAVSAEIGWNEGYYYSFNVTQLVQNWYTGVSNWQKGMIFRWNVDTMCYPMEKCFASSQYSNENYRPQLVVNLTPLPTISSGVYAIESLVSGTGYRLTASPKALDNLDSTATPDTEAVFMQSTAQTTQLNQLWRITHVQNGYYTIRPYHYTPAALRAFEYSTATDYLGYSDDWVDVDSSFLWHIRATPLPSGDCGNCFYVQPFGSGFCLETYSPTTTGTVSIGDNYGGSEHKWSFEEIGTPPKALRFYDRNTGIREDTPIRTLYEGEDEGFYDLGLYVSICVPVGYSLSPSDYAWMSGNVSVVLVTGNSPTFQCVNFGVADISAYIPEDENIWFEEFFTIGTFVSGKYAVRNEQSKEYMSFRNTSLCQSVLCGDNAQQWEFSKKEGTPYFTIKCTVDGVSYYVKSSTGVGSVSFVSDLNPDQITDNLLWEISYFNRNNLKISPKWSNGESVISKQIANSSLQNQPLEIRNNTYTGLEDQWTFLPIKYLYTVTHYYDEGFAARFGTDTVSFISKSHNDMAEVMLYLFGVLMESNICPFTSSSDICKKTSYPNASISDVLDEPCLCSNQNCVTSGKLREHLMFNIPTQTDISSAILWTGHFMDKERSNSSGRSIICTLYGMYYVDEATGDYVARDEDSQLEYAWTLLLHEMSHQLGTPDHYCRVANKDDGENAVPPCSNEYCDLCVYQLPGIRDCTMGVHHYVDSEPYENLLCLSCKQTIKDYLGDNYGGEL